MPPKNLGSLLFASAARLPDKKALLFKTHGGYLGVTYRALADKVRALATFLRQNGIAAGDRVAILSENRPEWAVTDLALQCLGAASVPIYTSLTPREIEYLLADSAAKAVAVSNKVYFEKIQAIQAALPALKFIIAFEEAVTASQSETALPIRSFSAAEKTTAAPDIETSSQAIEPDALASIIYTSGTTGEPKGVMLTHANFLHNVVSSQKTLKMGETDIHLSFLPLSHVFERMAGHYLMLHIGATIAYAETMDTVPQNLLEVRPTFILGVPRFYEKIRDRVLEAVKAGSPVRKALFFWAKDLGEKKRLTGKTGFAYRMAELLVYKKFRARLGGRVRFCVAGGAPLAKELAEFFYDLGVMIYEGYGLTETSPVISVNLEGKFRFGTVGVPLDVVEVKIAEDGEVLTKGPCVMKGYYQKPAETAAVLSDGWFATGDLGFIDKDGFLTINGRKKELIVTSGGKKIAARAVESLIEEDPYILRCVLFGEGRKYLTALIVPRQEKLTEYAQSQKIACAAYADLLKDTKIHQYLEHRIEERSKDLASFERIKYFVLLENDFSQAAGELTPTLKIKRDVVIARHKDALLRFYETGKPLS